MCDRLIVHEPFIRLGDGATFGIAESIPVLVRRDHRFEQMNHGVELALAEPVEQMMSVISVSGHCDLSRNRSLGRAEFHNASAGNLQHHALILYTLMDGGNIIGHEGAAPDARPMLALHAAR